GRRLAYDAREWGALGAVALAGRAEAAVEVDLDARRLSELCGGQLRAALVEVVGDAHRADRVGAGRSGSDLVELLDRGHYRPFRLLDDVELGRQGDLGRCRRRGLGLLFGGHRAARDHGGRAHHRAAHHERAPIHAGRDFALGERAGTERIRARVLGLHGPSLGAAQATGVVRSAGVVLRLQAT